MKEQILKLREEGKTYKEIQDLTGASKGTIAYHLGEGQKDKYRLNNLRKKARDREWITEIKKDLKCSECGESRWWLLDFHHEDPQLKDGAVSQLIKCSSKDKVLEEIKKCRVLCANCHRDLHHKEKLL